MKDNFNDRPDLSPTRPGLRQTVSAIIMDQAFHLAFKAKCELLGASSSNSLQEMTLRLKKYQTLKDEANHTFAIAMKMVQKRPYYPVVLK